MVERIHSTAGCSADVAQGVEALVVGMIELKPLICRLSGLVDGRFSARRSGVWGGRIDAELVDSGSG